MRVCGIKTVVFVGVSLMDLELPRPGGIKYLSRIEVISFEFVCTTSKLHQSAGVW